MNINKIQIKHMLIEILNEQNVDEGFGMNAIKKFAQGAAFAGALGGASPTMAHYKGQQEPTSQVASSQHWTPKIVITDKGPKSLVDVLKTKYGIEINKDSARPPRTNVFDGALRAYDSSDADTTKQMIIIDSIDGKNSFLIYVTKDKQAKLISMPGFSHKHK